MLRKITPLFLLISAFFLFLSCSQNNEPRFYLDNYWQWGVGADDGSVPESIITGEGLTKLAINQEKDLASVFDDKSGYVWLRADFNIPEKLRNQDLGIYVGCIKVAGQVFINGKTVGTSGFFPPEEFSNGTEINGFTIPYGLINQDGTNSIIIKIWTNSVGSISSRVYLTTAKEVFLSTELENFFVSKINLCFAGIMILIAVFYFLIYLTRKEAKEHLMFSLLNFFSAFFLLPLYNAEIPWLNSSVISYLWFEKLFTGVIAHITVFFAASFMRSFLHQKTSRKVLAIRLIVLIIPCILILLAPSYSDFAKIFPFSFAFVAIQMGFGIFPMLKGFINKDRDVFILLLGFSPVCCLIILDFIVHIILKNTTQQYFTIMGWQGSIIVFLLILSIRFNIFHKKFVELNGRLEAEVEQRTLDLIIANKILKKEQDITQRDMSMAVDIQKSFYMPINQQFFGWDIAGYFNPQSGVSGDLYDYYENGDYLDGVSIFDVSGHGISAGLVTMLAKNIIRREFQRGVNQNINLSTTLENINKAIINAKGSIENYLTGLVVKFGESYQNEICRCQIVNAGHPHPLLYSSVKNDVEEVYSVEKKSVGMIGIEGIEVQFPSYNFSMGNHDVLVLFSDGVIEYKNKNDEEYGKERLSKILKAEGFTSAKKILNAILKDIGEFVENLPQQDDITILVLKRDKDADYIPEL